MVRQYGNYEDYDMNFLKRLFCNHKNKQLLRWHYTHGYNAMEPRFIKAEYKCPDCGKVFYLDIRHRMRDFEEKHKEKRW